MEEQNVVLEMKKCDVTSLDDVRALVAGIGNASVLRGVIHSAMVIQVCCYALTHHLHVLFY
jgi:hypothetical protein